MDLILVVPLLPLVGGSIAGEIDVVESEGVDKGLLLGSSCGPTKASRTSANHIDNGSKEPFAFSSEIGTCTDK